MLKDIVVFAVTFQYFCTNLSQSYLGLILIENVLISVKKMGTRVYGQWFSSIHHFHIRVLFPVIA